MSRCKANPCCGDPVYCEVPLAQDRTGLYHLNGYSEPASPPSPSPTQHTGWSDEAVEVGTFIAASEHGVGVSWGDLGPLKSGDKLYAKAALTAASSIAPTTGFEVKALEWGKRGEYLSRAQSPFGVYRVWSHDDAGGKWFWSITDGSFAASDGPIDGTTDDEKTGFAAAQAHFDAAIRSCISPSVSKESGEL